MKTKHQLLQEWNKSTYGLEFGDYVYQYFVSEFNKPPVYGQRVINEIEQLRKMANHAPDNEYKAGFLKAITNVKAILNEYAPSPGSVDVEEKKEYCDGTFYCSLDSTYNSDGTCGGCGKKKRNGVDGLGDSSGSEKHQSTYDFVDQLIVWQEQGKFRNWPEADTNLLNELIEQGKKAVKYDDESVKEVSREGEIAELHEKLEEITFYEEEARRQIGIRDQLLEDIFYNRLKPEVIKHKIDQILNLPF